MKLNNQNPEQPGNAGNENESVPEINPPMQKPERKEKDNDFTWEKENDPMTERDNPVQPDKKPGRKIEDPRADEDESIFDEENMDEESSGEEADSN